MTFSSFFNKYTLLSEISQEHVNRLPKNIKDLLQDKKLPFNSIFGDRLRIIEPLRGGKEYKLNISKQIGDNYNLDFDKWVGYKISDKDKKNPIRLGKILTKRKQEVERWARDSQDIEVKQSYEKLIDDLNTLLKTTNLQKQVADAESTSLYVVYSRAPIDVVRMGDMGFKQFSCHSPSGSYFYCALADAMMNAGVAYLISEEDYEINRLDLDENLQADEIFYDNDRNIDGLGALARIRIRLVLDEEGNELAVPTTKIYAKQGYEYNDDFKDQMISWARKQNVDDFNWDSTLTLKGGSYEDYSYSIEDQVKLIWGKKVKYTTSDDDSEFQDEEGVYEEHFYDEVKNELDMTEDSEIFEPLFGTDDWNTESGIVITITHGNRIRFSYILPDALIDKIGKEKIYSMLDESEVHISGWNFSRNYSQLRLNIFEESPSLYDFGEYYGRDMGGNFNYSAYYTKCQNLITETLDAFVDNVEYNEEGELPWNYRYKFNEKILSFFGIEIDGKSDVNIADAITDLSHDTFGDVTLIEDLVLDDISDIHITSKDLTPRKIGHSYDSNSAEVIFSELTARRLRNKLDIIENHVFEQINRKYNDIFDKTEITLSTTLTLPATNVPNIETFARLYAIPENNYSGPETKVILTNSTKIEHPQVSVSISYNPDSAEINSVIDSMMVVPIVNLWNNDLHGEGDFDEFLDMNALERKLKQNMIKHQDDELRQQGQMDLDLSSINKNMAHTTAFNQVYQSILLELNFGKGGISNQSGNPTQGNTPTSGAMVAPQSGTQMQFAGKPKYSAQTPGAAQQPQVNPQQGQPPQVDPKEMEEFNNLLALRQKNPAQFQTNAQQLQQDPERYQRFFDYALTQIPQ